MLDEKTSRIRKQKIETGLANWKFVEINSGLTVGDRVVGSVAGPILADGVLVRVKKSPDTTSR
ncbi:MAG TPA: hypothetical protein ENK89_01820 [Desulfobulbaceae bacterium]|nr:hypothetical protein [Desulfobulbaceae bacterium]